jgi:hypothetical protein
MKGLVLKTSEEVKEANKRTVIRPSGGLIEVPNRRSFDCAGRAMRDRLCSG